MKKCPKCGSILEEDSVVELQDLLKGDLEKIKSKIIGWLRNIDIQDVDELSNITEKVDRIMEIIF